MKENITVIHVTNLGHFVIFSNSYLSCKCVDNTKDYNITKCSSKNKLSISFLIKKEKKYMI
jgi:hypothetical protein